MQAEYLVLLGSPAAAVLAKTFTSTQVANGTTSKPPAEEDPGLVEGAAQAISNDEGRTDLFDFQYFLFNVVALLYFFGKFLPQPQEGLPNLPPTLVALTGVAAAAYATKKGLPTDVPVLTGVYPASAAPGEQVLVRGKNLTISEGTDGAVRVLGENISHETTDEGSVVVTGDDPVIKRGTGGSTHVRVRFGGRYEQTVQLADVQPAVTDEIQVRVPDDAEPDKPAPVVVIRADGIATEAIVFDVVAGGPRITAVRPSRIVLDTDEEIVIDGVGFKDQDTSGVSKNAIMLDQRELEIRGWGPKQVRARLPTMAEAQSQQFTLNSSVELVVQDRDGQVSQPETVQLLG